MLVQSSEDWSIFKRIFADRWDAFTYAHPRYQTPYYGALVAKMVNWGHPTKRGYVEYRGQHCGQGKHLGSMRG
jgi:hypothetical protein